MIAKGAGYANTYSFEDLEEFSTTLEEIMNQDGPVFVSIKVKPEVENLPIGLRERKVSRSRDQTISALRKDLGL